MNEPDCRVISVHLNPLHRFSKQTVETIRLLAGLGVEGDAHCGATVQHRSRVAADPSQSNLRQVHLIAQELLDELNARGFFVRPGDLGENITTRGIGLITLPRDTRMVFPGGAALRVTGLRNPCAQLDHFRPGLLAAVLEKLPDGTLLRKAGIMAVVEAGGAVRAGDALTIQRPPLPHLPLERV